VNADVSELLRSSMTNYWGGVHHKIGDTKNHEWAGHFFHGGMFQIILNYSN